MFFVEMECNKSYESILSNGKFSPVLSDHGCKRIDWGAVLGAETEQAGGRPSWNEREAFA